ncbi:caspase family protein [Aureimonas jatrophae]|nr:caspase family protein [Aureimonas jatrophae]MBB3952655.1 hypothetical protein [Aureimonas jatrophae]
MNERHALVIGADAYPGAELSNAVGDARRVAAALTMRGFSTEIVLDPELSAVESALADFRSVARNAELAMIYLAGHAVERHGNGFFLPVDFEFPLTVGRLRFMATPLNAFVDATEGAASRILVLDACRNWPHDPDEGRRTLHDLEELSADERSWPNLLLAYATSSTEKAGDGAEGQGSVFSRSLCRHLLDHALTVDECLRRVSQDVVAHRRGQQPWTYSSLASTQSFTDLPRFAVIQRHAVPNHDHSSLGTWTTMGVQRRSVFVGLGDSLAWNLDFAGSMQIPYHGEDRLVGAAVSGRRIYLSGSRGALYAVGVDGCVLQIDVPHSNGLAASPTGDGFVHYGASFVSCLKTDPEVEEIVRHDVGFDVYCCSYMPDGLVWIAGDEGRICEIDPRKPDGRTREIGRVRTHVNAMAVAPDGQRIYVVGQSGLAVELDRSGRQTAELLPARQFGTAAGIRARLHDMAEDEVIHRFIFEPSKLRNDVQKKLVERLGVPDYHACAASPTMPILAVATQESSVVLLDTRDRQVIQELDVGSGNPAIVSGVHFLSDRELVVVGGHGEVTFFGAWPRR